MGIRPPLAFCLIMGTSSTMTSFRLSCCTSKELLHFDDDLIQLVIKCVDGGAGAPCEVKGLVVQHGERGSQYGPPWYMCLVRGPGGTVIAKDATAYDSFIGWLRTQTPQRLAQLCPGADIPNQEELRQELQRLNLARARTRYDCTPYGSQLASRVAKALTTGKQVSYSHRDYCGVGLGFTKAKGFVMGPVFDGYLDEGHVWSSQKDFVNWLAAQSDFTLSGYDPDSELVSAWHQGNQRITRERLNAVVG